MRFLFTADWHLSKYGHQKNIEETNLSERLNGITNTLYQMGNYCKDNYIETMVVGGDINHTKSIIYSTVLDILVRFIVKFNDLRFIFIDGNHDLSGKGAGVVSSLVSLDSLSNVFRVEGEKEKYYLDKKNDILYVPFSTKMTEIIKNNSAKYLVSHFGLSEALLSSGMSLVSDLGVKDLENKYQNVLLGHYHKPQEICKNNLKIFYVGSTIQLDWGEKHEEKRFLVVNTDNDEIISVPTTGYKKYFELEVTQNNLSEMVKKAEEIQEAGHFVQLKKIEKVDTSNLVDRIRVIDRTEQDITNRGVSVTMSRAEKFERYMEIKEIPTNERQLYSETFIHIVDSCSEET